MKAQFLKMAGVKTEEEFYKKFPTKESFYAKYGKKIKKEKAFLGNLMQGAKSALNKIDGEKLIEALGSDPIGDTINMVQGFKQQKDQVAQARQNMQVMGFMEDATASNKLNQDYELQQARMKTYVRPEDNVMTGEELFPIYGVGTNVLAKNGKKVEAQKGFMGMSGAQWSAYGKQALGQGMDAIMGKTGIGNDMGSKLGGKIGGIASAVTGIPFLDKAGMVLGDIMDPSDNKINKYNNAANRSLTNMAGTNFGSFMQNQFSNNMKNGGKIYGDGGDIQVYEDGGGLTPISHNPYGGEMHMINGPSHARGGVDMQVFDTPIEAEGGEPIQRNSDGNISIMGNLEVPNFLKNSAESFTGEKLKGKKFKSVSKSLGDAEAKANMMMEKSIEKAENYSSLNKLDRISLKTLNLNKELADKKLQKLQIVKDTFADVQEVMADGNEYAKDGKKLYAQDSATIKKQSGAAKQYTPLSGNDAGYYGNVTDEHVRKLKAANSWFDFNNWDPKNKEDVLRLQKEYNSRTSGVKVKEDGLLGNQTASLFLAQSSGAKPMAIPTEEADIIQRPPLGVAPIEEEEKKPWFDLAGIPSYFKGTNAQDFDPSQLIPEAWAMANNKLEPVQAQKFNPRLRVPYDISLQDQKNEVIADSRASKRLLAQNPQLAGALHAQTANALSKIGGEEFRLNQAMKDQVYSGNLAILNEAQLKNLDIADQQYVRQAEAKSKTKATDFEAIKSMTDKRMKHALENKTLRVWENMYDYRYDNAGNAWYMGPPADFSDWETLPPNAQTTDTKNYEYMRGQDGKVYRKKVQQQGTPTKNMNRTNNDYRNTNWNPSLGKNGMLVKQLKKYK